MTRLISVRGSLRYGRVHDFSWCIMGYRNFRTSNSGLSDVTITVVMAVLAVLGFSRPNDNIGAADILTPIPQPTIASSEPGERGRLNLPPNLPAETARVIEQRNLTEASRSARGLHHDRDFEGPSTLVERSTTIAPSTTAPLESDLGGIPLLPEAQAPEER